MSLFDTSEDGGFDGNPLKVGAGHYLKLQQSVAEDTIHVRGISQSLQLTQRVSDWHLRSSSHNVNLNQSVSAGVVRKTETVSQQLVLLQTVQIAGGRVIPPGTIIPTGKVLSNTLQGMAVYIDASGDLGLAIANSTFVEADVIGLMDQNTNAGDIGPYVAEGFLAKSDWTNVTGSTLLTTGVYYYLSDSQPGMLTEVATTAEGNYLVPVGRAHNPNTMKLDIVRPLKL